MFYIFTFVPLSQFYKFRCAGKLAYRVFSDPFNFPNLLVPAERILLEPVWVAAFHCLKVSMPFVQDFCRLQLTLDQNFRCDFFRMDFVGSMYHQYFGDSLRGGDANHSPVVNPDDLFPLDDPVCPVILHNWIYSCAATNFGYHQQHPARCLGTLRLAGFFSTRATRSKLAVSLQDIYNLLEGETRRIDRRMRAIVEFLKELNKQSFGFTNLSVDSRQWRVRDGISGIGLHPSPFTNLVVDLRKDDFDRLYLEYRKKYPRLFPVMSFGLTLPGSIQ